MKIIIEKYRTCSSRQFEETCENRTCNLCDFAFVQAGELRGQGHVYYNIWENRTHATNVTNVTVQAGDLRGHV